MPHSAPRFTGLDLEPGIIVALEAVLPSMAERAVAAIIAEVPAYTDPFQGRMGQNIENAVQASLRAFLRLAIRGGDSATDPSLSGALNGAYELGRGEARQGRSIDALLAASPEHARARMGLARLLLTEGDAESAMATIGGAVDHPGTRRAARQLAAQIAVRRGDATAAARWLAEAAALPADSAWPEDPLAAELPLRRAGKRSRIKLVSQLEQAGAIAEADALTARLERERPEIYLFIEGRMQMAKGDHTAAEKALRRALDFEPREVDVHFQLGRALALQGRRVEAAAVYRQLLAIEPAHGPAWLELGRCLMDSDRDAAMAALESAVAYMPASDAAREALGQARSQPRNPPAGQGPKPP
jgi:tetratricopeptide (TPR) repeat protein